MAVGATLIGVALAGCGHQAPPTAQKEVKAEVTKAEAVVRRCLPVKDGAPDPLLLRSKSGRVKFVNCAVPPSQRTNFRLCVTNGLLHGFPTKKHLESVAETCVNEVN